MPRAAQLGLVVVLAAVVVVGAVALSGNESKPAPSRTSEPGMTPAQEVAALYEGIPQDGVRLGSPEAPATLVEIADLQCPFCARYSTQVLPSIVDEYVRPGRIAYELRTRSFLGRDSVRGAGAAAEAARQDRMYQFVDLFFRDQGPENSDYADADFIRGIASQVEGLDVERVVAAADDPLSYRAVRGNEMFARRISSTGTPDFYVRKGGQLTPLRVQGPAPEDYAAAIDAALG
jgi:protein-disulfide isomerase